MRGIGATLCLVLVAGQAAAQTQASSVLSLYTDDDATDVVTSVTRVAAQPWEGGALEGSYLVDIISSASVDVVSQATPRFQENRHALGAAISQEFAEDYQAGISYGFSREPDYVGHGFSLNGSASLFRDNTTVAASYAIELSQIRRKDDANFQEGLTTHAIELRATQLLSRALVGEAGISLMLQDGYNAKPYRYARVGQVVPGLCRFCPPETHPRTRTRIAPFLGLKMHLFAESAAEVRYRFYLDSWGLRSHTAEALLHLGWTEAFGARLRYRIYGQNAATFYADFYDLPRQFMTADRELSPLTAHLTGLKLFVGAKDFLMFSRVRLAAKIDLFQYNYRDFSRLPRRRGLVVETGLEVEF